MGQELSIERRDDHETIVGESGGCQFGRINAPSCTGFNGIVVKARNSNHIAIALCEGRAPICQQSTEIDDARFAHTFINRLKRTPNFGNHAIGDYPVCDQLFGLFY